MSEQTTAILNQFVDSNEPFLINGASGYPAFAVVRGNMVWEIQPTTPKEKELKGKRRMHLNDHADHNTADKNTMRCWTGCPT